MSDTLTTGLAPEAASVHTPDRLLAPTAAALGQRVAALTAHFARVQTERMAGIPLLNLALNVEAVGFEWAALAEGNAEPVAEGVLITPWFMSLVRLPLRALPHHNQVARSFVRDFGCERFDFIGAHDEAIGYHETCALFSAMSGFPSQDVARQTALESLALVRPVADPAPPAQPEPMPARRAFFLARRQGSPASPAGPNNRPAA